MSEARDDYIAVLYSLGHLLISQVENAGLDDRRVRVLENLGGESVRRADDDANQVILGQQLFYNQPPCLACGSNHQNGHLERQRLLEALDHYSALVPCDSSRQ